MYEYGSGGPSCISCNPSGAPEDPSKGGAELPVSWSDTYALRDMSASGDRVFFNAAESLVPQDANHRVDVYEWERDGSGTCTRAKGCLYLLSGGTSADNSYFLDASETGADVFISTRAQLVPQDRNEVFDAYDVRVGAVEALAPPACTGSGCQGVPGAPPTFATPSSVTFNGAGNFPPPPAPKAKTVAEVRAEKLTRALKLCHVKRNRHRRALCESQARRRYGPAHKANKSNRRGK